MIQKQIQCIFLEEALAYFCSSEPFQYLQVPALSVKCSSPAEDKG